MMHVNVRPIPTERLMMGMGHKNTSVTGYRTLFEGSGIHHSNLGLHVTHDMYIAGYFMLLFDLNPELAASEGHVSHPDNGNIRIEARFDKAIPEAITCLLYLEYYNSVHVDFARNVATDFADNVHTAKC
jgi:hypothetical protein